MPETTLKQAKLSDLARVIYVTKQAYKTPYKKNTLITKTHEPKDVKEQFLSKAFFVIVAIQNNKIVGAIRYKFIGKNSLYFFKLAVLKTYRNKSIGSLLVNEIEKVANKKNCNKILLDCAQEKKLHDYYKKLCYKIDKIKKHLDHHDVYMSKKL
jgi:GNAT superfamily N-acetyltransferase